MHRILLALLLLGACRVERRPPVSERVSAEPHVLAALYAYYDTVGRGGSAAPSEPRRRLVRSDLRVQGDLAAAWVVTAATNLAEPGIETERPELLLMRRRGEVWEVVARAESAVR